MWSEVAEIAFDVLAPNPGPELDLERIFDKKNPDQLRVPLDEPDSFKRRLNQSGWFDEEVVAGGLLTQGKAQSLLSMATGWALVEMARARRSKSLPREFCVAVTPTRVVALALNPWSEGDGGENEVTEREAMTSSGTTATEAGGLDPVLPYRIKATDAAKEGCDVAGVGLAGDAL